MPIAAKAFAAFCFVLAGLALVFMWPPRSTAMVIWLIVWVTLCIATGIGILRRERHAAYLVWTILAVATLSAAALLRAGMLDTTGIIIDIVLFIPMIWFAVWYQRSRRAVR